VDNTEERQAASQSISIFILIQWLGVLCDAKQMISSGQTRNENPADPPQAFQLRSKICKTMIRVGDVSRSMKGQHHEIFAHHDPRFGS
jgi:hypothetical protein